MTILTFLASAGADATEPASTGGGLLSFALLPLMLVAMYFLIIRPNSKKRKAQQSLQSALGVGDEVITTAGIIGTITGEDGPTRFWLEIDEDVQVRIARGGISGRLDPDAVDSEKPDTATDPADDEVRDVENSADEAADQDS